ncbi:amino acid/polyamine transporter I [Paramyrothecium foliicola]|nr:amino acid/polyamine transporter I [Paramyrothecium foliicola]
METLTQTTSAHGHLQQRFSVLSTMAMAFAILNTWIALAGSIGLVLPSGGSSALLYGFLFCVICNFALAASLGELAAIWPTAGGQYHFVYALCTDRWRRPMSFLAGWANIFGWLSVITVQGFFAAQFISAAAVIASYERYEITEAKTYGIFIAILALGTIVNIWGNRLLGKWSDAALYWSIAAVLIISIILLAMSKKSAADFVFAEFNNETSWPDGVAWLLGLLQPAMSLIGYDVVMHMAEEMPHPSRDVPRAMIYAVAIGGVTGTIFILVTLFCFSDPTTILASTTGIPIAELILLATRSRAAATILNLMLALCFVNGTIASITSTSRLIYSMARDKGIFFSHFFSRISPTLNVPTRTVVASASFNVVFGLLYLGPYVAFSAYMSSCTIFLNVSYAMPVVFLLIRGRHVLAKFQYPGLPHQLGKLGLLSNVVAGLYVVLTTVVSITLWYIWMLAVIDFYFLQLFSFPTSLPVSADNMNYVIVVFGIFLIFVTAYWVVYGNSFTGPDFDSIFALSESTLQAQSSHIEQPPSSDNIEGSSAKGKSEMTV